MASKKQRKILVDNDIYQKLRNLTKAAHGGKIKGFLGEEIRNAIEFYITKGPLSEYLDTQIPEETSADDEKLTDEKFLYLFDNSIRQGGQHTYLYDRLDNDSFRSIIEDITGRTSDYNFYKYAKLLRNASERNNHNVRTFYKKGTPYEIINHTNFEFIESNLKKACDTRRDLRKLESYEQNTSESTIEKIYRKLEKGSIIEPEKIIEMMKCNRKKANKFIDEMIEDGLLVELERGFFKVSKRDEIKMNRIWNNGAFNVFD